MSPPSFIILAYGRLVPIVMVVPLTLALTERRSAPLRIIRLPCTGRIDPLFIIKAFERGADGVIVSGCHPADCHYTSGNYHARRRFAVFHDIMQFVGVDPRRITFSWVSASEGAKWRDVVDETVTNVLELGPYEAYRALAPQAVEAWPQAVDGLAPAGASASAGEEVAS